MLSKFKRLLGKKKPVNSHVEGPHKLIMTKACLDAIRQCLAKDTKRRHEGIAYLIGQVTEDRTIAVAAICPKASTTYGSFSVTSKDMGHIIKTASILDLQAVGQVHSHPHEAFLPQYGRKLPSLDGAAFFLFNEKGKFVELEINNVKVIPEVLV
jgi:hypothetical protein